MHEESMLGCLRARGREGAAPAPGPGRAVGGRGGGGREMRGRAARGDRSPGRPPRAHVAERPGRRPTRGGVAPWRARPCCEHLRKCEGGRALTAGRAQSGEVEAPETAGADAPEPEPEPAAPPAPAAAASPAAPAPEGSSGATSEGTEEALEQAFGQKAEEGELPLARVGEVLAAAGVEVPENLQELLALVVHQQESISLMDLKAVVAVVSRRMQAVEASPSLMSAGSSRRSLIESGFLTENEAVLSFIRALEEHKKKCEVEERYMEAKETAKRLAVLKEREAVSRREEMGARQQQEQKEALAAFEVEKRQQEAMWLEKVEQYEVSVEQQIERLKEVHREQMGRFRAEQEQRRPTRAKFSKELLNQRKIQKHLAKQGHYMKAMKLKQVSDKMEEAEMQATQATFEAEISLREQQLKVQQRKEKDALYQRAARGRGELQLTCNQDLQKREQRFKNVLAELGNLHRLENVQLDHFLSQQVLAGKRAQPAPARGGIRGLGGGKGSEASMVNVT